MMTYEETNKNRKYKENMGLVNKYVSGETMIFDPGDCTRYVLSVNINTNESSPHVIMLLATIHVADHLTITKNVEINYPEINNINNENYIESINKTIWDNLYLTKDEENSPAIFYLLFVMIKCITVFIKLNKDELLRYLNLD